ncbi:MAG: hypothetical protein JNJ53_08810 [Rhizobiales bacterium]|nr:hypothetical protein [Hyphomicrobiales bacterium]
MRQLPVLAALNHALQSVWLNRMVALRMSWIWYIIVAIVLAFGGQISATIRAENPQSPGTGFFLIEFGTLLFVLLVNSSFAVHWHRYILLDEVPGMFDTFRLDGRVWRYFGNSLLIMLALIIPSIALALPFVFIAAVFSPQLATLGSVIGVLIVVSIGFLRLGLKLPAIALGAIDYRFTDAWRASAGNSFRIAAVFLITMAVALVAASIITALSLSGSFLGVVLGFILQLVVNWFLTFFAITLLTSLYGFFVQNRDF